jgi:tripartite-type tricarboxylate transporter receptor subunit TctC
LKATPEVPTVAEAGVKGYDMTYWTAAYLPAGSAAPIVQQLNQAINKVMALPASRAFMDKAAVELFQSTPEGLGKHQATESKKWGEVIRAAGLQAE